MDQGEENPKHPLTGEPYDEEVERAKLIPLDKGDKPSKEIQTAFKNFVEEYIGRNNFKGEFRIIPEKLFVSEELPKQEWQSLFFRSYYQNPLNRSFDGLDQRAKLILSRSKNGYFAKIEKTGEHRKFSEQQPQEIDIQFSDRDRFEDTGNFGGFSKVLIHRKQNGRELSVYYNKDGRLVQIGEKVGQNKREIIENHFWWDRDKLNDLLNGKKFSTRKGEFKASKDKESREVTLTRSINGEVQDRIIIPLEVNLDEIFEQMFPKPLLEDGLNAETNLDEEWMSADLKNFGISWLMET